MQLKVPVPVSLALAVAACLALALGQVVVYSGPTLVEAPLRVQPREACLAAQQAQVELAVQAVAVSSAM